MASEEMEETGGSGRNEYSVRVISACGEITPSLPAKLGLTMTKG